MAVFIRKENLGSGTPHSRQLMQKIESLTSFKKLQQGLAETKEKKVAKLKDKFEGNAEIHRWRQMTAEEKTREAIDLMIPTTKAVQHGKTGIEPTHEEARKVAEDIANTLDRKKSEK